MDFLNYVSRQNLTDIAYFVEKENDLICTVLGYLPLSLK